MPHSFALFANEWECHHEREPIITVKFLSPEYSLLYASSSTAFLRRHHLHFITCSCYRHLPVSGTPERRDLFVQILEETRRKYQFVLHGYVVMPEHFHLLTAEPEIGDPSVVMKVIKERFTRALNRERRLLSEASATAVWERRFYDFDVWSARKESEKLCYMHDNPVKPGLVEQPEQWKWSSYRDCLYGEAGPVRVNFQEWPLKIKQRSMQTFTDGSTDEFPLIRKNRE